LHKHQSRTFSSFRLVFKVISQFCVVFVSDFAANKERLATGRFSVFNFTTEHVYSPKQAAMQTE